MKIEDQVCSVEQAIKLKKLGVNLDSLFLHYHNADTQETGIILSSMVINNERDYDIYYHAYTVAELGILLPVENPFNLCGIQVMFYKEKDKWISCCDNNLETYFIKNNHSEGIFDTEAQARADALIWLIDEKYIDPKDLKL